MVSARVTAGYMLNRSKCVANLRVFLLKVYRFYHVSFKKYVCLAKIYVMVKYELI